MDLVIWYVPVGESELARPLDWPVLEQRWILCRFAVVILVCQSEMTTPSRCCVEVPGTSRNSVAVINWVGCDNTFYWDTIDRRRYEMIVVGGLVGFHLVVFVFEQGVHLISVHSRQYFIEKGRALLVKCNHLTGEFRVVILKCVLEEQTHRLLEIDLH